MSCQMKVGAMRDTTIEIMTKSRLYKCLKRRVKWDTCCNLTGSFVCSCYSFWHFFQFIQVIFLAYVDRKTSILQGNQMCEVLRWWLWPVGDEPSAPGTKTKSEMRVKSCHIFRHSHGQQCLSFLSLSFSVIVFFLSFCVSLILSLFLSHSVNHGN